MFVARVFRFQAGEIRQSVLVVISVLVLIGAAVSIVHTLRGPRVNIDYGPYESLGEVTAEETAQLLHDRGRVVVWLLDLGGVVQPVNRTVLDQFRRSLRAHPHIRVVDVEWFRPEIDAQDDQPGIFSTRQFRQLLDKHREVDAIVSFAGMPPLTANDIAQLGEPRPKIIAVPYVCASGNLKLSIQKDVVQVAIVPRLSPTRKLPENPSPRERFEQYYSVVTAQTVKGLELE